MTNKYFLMIFTLITILSSLTFSSQAMPKPSQSHFAKYTRDEGKKEDKKPYSISKACEATPFPSACDESLLSLSTFPATKQALFDQSVQFTMAKAHSAWALAYNLTAAAVPPSPQKGLGGALGDCLELFDDTLDLLSGVVRYEKGGPAAAGSDDVHTWLSAALTNQETCLDSLEEEAAGRSEEAEAADDGGAVVAAAARNMSRFIGNSLSLFVSSAAKNPTNPKPAGAGGGRKLLSFPAWTTAAERRLLEKPVEEIKAHAVVAADGSGTHRTIAEAIKAVAEVGTEGEGGRTVIYVKEGTHNEYIKIPTKQKNVMLVGDGKDKTVIVGNKNSEDGSTTYNSATVGAMGDGFIARDITFKNSAGPDKQQAVALRVGSDRSVVYRCSIQGYQDSLYTHSKRQFYRETDISGTVDFIFGNSAAVFQSCSIAARSSGRSNFVTAQGRSSPDQNTGISIHHCSISAASYTYLGRPWKQYSRTVVMESSLAGSISPAGWSPWSGGFALKTLFYGEYKNTGPGASTSRRVGWPGYHSSLTVPQANSFTVSGFISGDVWLPSTGVSFDSGLVG